MIVIIAKTTLKEGKKQDFIDASRDLAEKTRREEGCVSYEVYEDLSGRGGMIIFEKWRDQACLDAHLATAHYLAWKEAAGSFRHEGPELIHYRQVW
ncbi:MAG: antibiotic biosynthesis monooxygenase [Desulfarculales bacterium]|nr:antibiotic biosynthesis monooxygenase [Desulfarculales bacterium]